MNIETVKPYVIIVGFILTLLFGSGAVFTYWKKENIERESERKVSLAAIDLYEKLNQQESSIAEAASKYFQEKPNEENKYLLISSINAYNRIEARLSYLESRTPNFFKPILLFPKSKATMDSVTVRAAEFDKYLYFQIEKSKPNPEIMNEIEDLVENIVDGYDEKYRTRFYEKECGLGKSEECTNLALQLSNYPQSKEFSKKEVAMLRKGCWSGDPFGCEILSFHYFAETDYKKSLLAGERACDFSIARACGFLGSLYASQNLDDLADYEKARFFLSKSCFLKNAKGCYYRAYLQISGHIEKNDIETRKYLRRGCYLGHELSCLAEKNFDDFSICGNKEYEDVALQESTSLSISCAEDSNDA